MESFSREPGYLADFRLQFTAGQAVNCNDFSARQYKLSYFLYIFPGSVLEYLHMGGCLR